MSFSRIVLLTLFVAFIGALVWRKPPTPSLDNRIDPTTVSDAFDPLDTVGTINGTTVTSPNDSLAQESLPSQNAQALVLGDDTLDKHIEVDLSTQTLVAYEGGAAVYTFPVSTGLWGKTPTGTFRIWGKFRYTKMEGGSKERHTYYYLPNVPYVMFFGNEEVANSRGFSLHGAYWHDNFGHPMSHGCVNMRVQDAGVLYDWVNPKVPAPLRSILSTNENPGTEVIIFGESPKS